MRIIGIKLKDGEDSVIKNLKPGMWYPIPMLITIIYNRIFNPSESMYTHIHKGLFLFLLFTWGFILIEQYRMRRKREKYGLISDKPWNQFDIEDC